MAPSIALPRGPLFPVFIGPFCNLWPIRHMRSRSPCQHEFHKGSISQMTNWFLIIDRLDHHLDLCWDCQHHALLWDQSTSIPTPSMPLFPLPHIISWPQPPELRSYQTKLLSALRMPYPKRLGSNGPSVDQGMSALSKFTSSENGSWRESIW